LIESGRASTPEALRQMLRDHANEAGPPGDDPLYGAGILNGARLENIGRRGVIDIAVADLYPAVEQRDGSTFPLHVSFENRGTDYIPEAAVELTINGFPAYYRLLGLNPGAVDSIQIPVPESALSGSGFTVDARVSLPAHYTDAQPGNDRGEIRLASDPVE
jgi:hypothetical protein